jgi:hypothetical protein
MLPALSAIGELFATDFQPRTRYPILDQKAILIIMAKQPVNGTVKTRLCPPLTPDGALALYEAFLLDTIALVDAACKLAGNVTPALAYSPPSAHDYFRDRLPEHFVLLPKSVRTSESASPIYLLRPVRSVTARQR